MYRFKITCQSCAAENIQPARRLLVRVEDRTLSGGECVFTCLSCRRTTVVQVDRDAVAAMLLAGVAWLTLAEQQVAHPEDPADGPQLTSDDLLDLHDALAGDTWFEALHAAPPRDA
jgi:hypothetical protein